MRRWGIAIAYAIAAVCALAIDLPVTAYFKKGVPRFLGEFFENCEVFGNGYGVAMILIAVVVLDRTAWKVTPLLIAGSLGSGLISNILKLTLGRTRPRQFDFSMTSVWDTFQRMDGSQSMPSSHTATAVGLAVVLSALYPRGRWYFAILAALVGMQRIVTLSHYPSDVFGGAAVGSLIGMWAVARMYFDEKKARGESPVVPTPTPPTTEPTA